MKVKKSEIAYIKGIKNPIIEKKIKDSVTPEEYATLTTERRNELIEREGKKAYHDVWMQTRIYWIKEHMWKQEDEEEFRTEMGYTQETSITKIGDFVTLGEWDRWHDHQEKKRKKEEEFNTETNQDRKREIGEEIADHTAKIKKIKDDAKERIDTLSWPPYYEDKGRQRRRRGQSQESLINEEDTENEDE